MTRTVITAWSAVSAHGVGADALVAGLGADASSPLERDRWPVPAERAWLVPGFDVREALGTAGTKSMDRVSGLAVLTARHVGAVADDAGLVLGVTNGSAQSIHELTRDSLVKARPEFVKPGQFPNTLMNSASAQCAIWHRLRGPNTTVAAGRTSGLAAMTHARRLQRAGRADAVLCGAAEEYSVTRAWLSHHTASGPALGEGCALFLLEPEATAGRTELAEVVALSSGVFADPADATRVLARCVSRVLEPGADLWAAATAHDPAVPVDRVADAEIPLPVADLVGDTHAASAAFGVAVVLAAARRDPRAADRLALVTAVDRDGTAACALLRVLGAAG